MVVAHILAAPLIDMAAEMVRLVAHDGRLLLSGIPQGVAADVARAYRNLGMRQGRSDVRAGWICLQFDATW